MTPSILRRRGLLAAAATACAVPALAQRPASTRPVVVTQLQDTSPAVHHAAKEFPGGLACGMAGHTVDAQRRSAAFDLVITVCDNAAGEACAFWPGAPATAHWGYPDPSEVQGSEEERLQACCS